MLIQEKIGNIDRFELRGRGIDLLRLEWYETGKRIMRKRTEGGRDVALKFLRESPALGQGDVLYEDETVLIVVDILLCAAIVINPVSWQQAAAISYEIGNRHLPLFIEGEELLAPWEEPLLRQLQAGGYTCRKEERRLGHPLRTSVAAHGHGGGGLLSKVLQLTNPGT